MILLDILLLSTVTAAIAFTVTETKVFEPLRIWMKHSSEFFGKLFSCGYCLGYWVSFAILLLGYETPILFPNYHLIFNYIFSWFLIAWLSGFQWIIMCYLFKLVGK